jgi:D-tyrosyl-tRNA(Tyr) deacylase
LADGVKTGGIDTGFLVLLGVEKGDGDGDAVYLADKVCGLRIFEDEAGKMGLSLGDVGGEMIIVSNFTLTANCRKGRRPDFTDAAAPEEANRLYEYFISLCRGKGITVYCGVFGAHMEIISVNDGPVTIIMDTRKMRNTNIG